MPKTDNPYQYMKQRYQKIMSNLETVQTNLALMGSTYNEYNETELEEDIKFFYLTVTEMQYAFAKFRAKMVLGHEVSEVQNGIEGD